MMKRLCFVMLVTLILGACTSHPYQEIKSDELASGVRYDSVFLGLKFGMTKQEFFDRCWELNKQKLVKEGPANSSVQYPIPEALNSPAVMQFYPNFHEGRAYEVQTTFYYNGWAPWNRHLYADSLKSQVQRLLTDWYGGSFTEINDTGLGDVLVRMDGNRRIVIGVRDDQMLDVSITDMTVADLLMEDPLLK